MKGQILIFDEHRLYLDVFTKFLENDAVLSKFKFSGITDSAFFSGADPTKIDLIVLNLCGVMATEIKSILQEMKAKNDEIKIVIISKTADVRAMKKCYEAGVKSFLGKDTGTDECLFAIKQVLAGKVYITEEVKKIFLESLYQTETDNAKKNFFSEELTTRELEVLRLLCEGLRTREIAETLFISSHTVDTHKRNIMMKYGVNNISKLVKYSIENRIV